MSDDKKYSLYKYLESKKWDELPASYTEFNKRLEDRTFFDKTHTIVSSLGEVEEAKLSSDEFYNYFNSTKDTTDILKYETPETVKSEVPWYQPITDFLTAPFNPDPYSKISTGQDVIDFGLGVVNLIRSIPGWLENTQLDFATRETLKAQSLAAPFLSEEEKQKGVKFREDLEKYTDEVLVKTIGEFSKTRKRIREDWVELGLVKEEPTIVGEFFQGLGFTSTILLTSFIPGVGIPLGFSMGMSAEGMNLAADVYEGTGGDLVATKYALGVGTVLGMSEIFSPIEAVSFVKKGIAKLLIKNLKEGFKKEALQTYFKTGLRQVGKQFSIESTQEAFQTFGEERVFIDVGMSQKVDWDNVFKAGIMGGLTGVLVGGVSVSAGIHNQFSKMQDFIKKTLPKELDRLTKLGLVTEEERTRVLKEYEGNIGIDDLRAKINSINENIKFNNEVGTSNYMIGKAKKLAGELDKVFTDVSTVEATTKAIDIANKELEEGTLLNTLDSFLINHITSSGAKIPEFDNLKVMNAYTSRLLGRIQSTKEFVDTRAKVKEQTGLSAEELTRATHEAILNTNSYPELKNGYMNQLVNNYPVLLIMESSLEDENMLIEPDKDLVFNQSEESGKLEERIKRQNGKIAFTTTKAAGEYADNVRRFNEQMIKEDNPKRYSFDMVWKGEQLVYRVNQFEVKKEENSNQIDIEFNQTGINKEVFPESVLQGNNIQPFNNPSIVNVTSKFDDWIDKQQGKIDLSQPFKVSDLKGFGQNIVEKFRQEYLVKNNFTFVPKERIQDFKKDWNNWLKENFGLRSKEGYYGDLSLEGETKLYGLSNIMNTKPWLTKEIVEGSEVIISGNYLFKDLAHTYEIPDATMGETLSIGPKGQEGAGLGWYIYSEINGEPFIYEWQSDILPDLFGKSVSSTTKEKDSEGKVTSETEVLTSGEVRISDKDGTKYYIRDPVFESVPGYLEDSEIQTEAREDYKKQVKEITKQEFEAKKEELSKQGAEESLSSFAGTKRGKIANQFATFWDNTGTRVTDDIQNVSNKSVLPTLENLYKRYWNIWLMHSFMYAKEKGHNTVWLPTGEAMYEIEGSEKTAAMYATKWDVQQKENLLKSATPDSMIPAEELDKYFNKVGPYWTALNKIKGIRLELAKPEWSTVSLIKADISGVNTGEITLFQTGKRNEEIKGITEQLKKTPAFQDQAGFLSNFSPYKSGEEFVYEGISYPSNEHFYQAQKFTDKNIQKRVAEHPAKGLKAFTRTLGKIREDWNTYRNRVMQIGLEYKFSLPRYKELLLSTGKEELVERNTWGDKYWGQVDGIGENRLGKRLMEIRDRIAKQPVVTISSAPLLASNEIKRLTSKGFSDSTLQPVVEWLSDMFGDIEVRYDRTQKEPAQFKWQGKTGHKFITINPTHIDIGNGKNLYKSIAHELVHNATFSMLRNDGVFRKQLDDLYNEIKSKVISTTFYEENQDDLDRIFYPRDEEGNIVEGHDLYEFLAYVLSNTSVLREWMRVTEFRPGTPWLKRFYRQIQDGLWRLYNKNPKDTKITYLQGLETLMNQTMGFPPTSIEPLGIPFFSQFSEQQYNTADIIDKALGLEDEALGDVRSMSSFVNALELDLNTDPYAYIQGLTKDEFYTVVNRSETLDERMQVYYDSKFKVYMTYDEYKQKVSTYVYNNIKSSKKRKIASLYVASNGVASVKYYDRDFKTKKGDFVSSYHSLTMMDEILPYLNQLFNTNFQLVYLEEIIDETVWTPDGRTKSGKPHKIYFNLNNSQLQKLFASVGIIFPGTFADKDTLIGFVEVDKANNVIKRDYNSEEEGIISITDALSEIYLKKMNELVESGKVDDTYLKKVSPDSIASVVRLVLEDLRMGGRIENNQLTSALFNPEYPDTYDAIKMFKRPYLVAPKYIAIQLADEVRYIVDKVVKEIYGNNINKSGIVVKNGKVYYRAVIFDDELLERTGDVIINGKPVNIKKMLVNDYGTPTTDGGFIYGLGGFDVVYKYLVGAVKQGAIKLWGGNNMEREFNAPFFFKTAGHGYSQQDNIIQWARDNNISLIIPLSSVKINRFTVQGLMENQMIEGIPEKLNDGQVVEIPMDNLFRLQEKDEITDIARGMQQTITTNFMSYANEAFDTADEKREFWNLIKDFTNNLINRFVDNTTTIDKEGLLDYIKDVITKPENEYHKGLSAMLSNLLVTYADERVKELSDEQKEDKELVAELLRDKRLSNRELAERVSGLFYHPYFKQVFNDYMHRVLKELLFYDIPGGYSVLTPDIGWLAQTRIELASKFAMTLAKTSIEQEISNVYFGQQIPKEEEKEVLKQELVELDKEVTVLDEEREGILAASVAAVKEGKEELVVELEKRQKEVIAEIDAIHDKVGLKEEAISELDKELGKLGKLTEGYIKEDRVIVDGRKPEVQEVRDKVLYKWIDKESGRIKGNYLYISADIAKQRGVTTGSTAITGVVPSDSAQSVSGGTIIGVMNSKISESNKIVGWSEYFQSQLGKDHDFDTVLFIAYSKIFGSELDFQKLADVFTRTKENYPTYILRVMRNVLGNQKLQLKDIYSKAVRTKYMQTLAKPAEAFAVYNPLYHQNILNKYKKEVGQPVNKRKMATFKSLVKFKTKFVMFDNVFEIDFSKGSEEIDKTHIYHLIETNAKVDMPTDDTSLKYQISKVREFDLENGINVEGIVRNIVQQNPKKEWVQFVLPKYIEMLKRLDKFLFGYGLKVSTKNNLDDFNEIRALQDSVKYMRMQRRINTLLKTKEGRQTLYANFESSFPRKSEEKVDLVRRHLMRAAQQYILNIEMEDIENSIPMYLVNQTDLSTLPNLELAAGEYIAVEESTARSMVRQSPVRESLMAVANEYKPVLDNIQKELGQPAAFNKMLFLLTRQNEQLHILKGEILRVVNMFISGDALMVSQPIVVDKKTYTLTRFKKDLSVRADDVIFPAIFDAMMDKANISIRSTAPKSVDLRVENDVITVTVEGNKIRFGMKGTSVLHNELNDLIREGDPTGKAFRRLLDKAFGEKQGVNRGRLSGIVDFSNTLDMEDRWAIIGQYIVPVYQQLNDNDKQLLLNSLLSYLPDANESIFTGQKVSEPSNDRLFTLLSLMKGDRVADKFLKDYAHRFGQSVPHPGFTKGMDAIRTIEGSDADYEVWNMQSPKIKSLDKNLRDLVQEEKTKGVLPYDDITQGVSKIVNLKTGVITDISIQDVAQITGFYLPSKDTPKGDVEVLQATILKHMGTIAAVDALYKETDIEVAKLEEQFFGLGDKSLLNFTKPQEQNQFREDVEELVSKNMDGISIIKQGNNYIYNYLGNSYNSPDELLNAMTIIDTKQRIKYQTALKWHIVYSVENPKLINSMLDYLNSIMFEFGTNTYAIQMVVNMVKRYTTLSKSMSQRAFHYYPRVYKQHIFETKIMNWLKVQEAIRVEQEIQDAVTYVNANQDSFIPNTVRDLASHYGDSAWILETAKEKVEREKFNIGMSTFGKYVNSFSLKRELPDEIDGIKYYIRDSFIPHQRHQAQMLKMLKNDLLFANWLSFQHKAVLNRVDPDTIEAVKAEVATIAGNRMLLSRDISINEILPGQEISFYNIDDKYFSGVVDKVDDDNIYLKLDKSKYEAYLQEKLKEYEKIHRNILGNPAVIGRAPTYKQLAVLQDFMNLGYITMNDILSITTVKEASENIIRLIKEQMDDSNNWGRFQKRDLFRKNLSYNQAGIQPTGESGVYRYLEFGSIEYLQGMARELDNTYDGQLSQSGFGEIVSSGQLLPYLKYEALQIPGQSIDVTSKGIALIGLSTPAAGIKNRFDGMAAVIRDRGAMNFSKSLFPTLRIASDLKSAIRKGEVVENEDILQVVLNAGRRTFLSGDKEAVIKEIAKRFLLENGLIFEDYLIASVAGDIKELFIEDERSRVEYTFTERLFNLYKTILDAWGYKAHRDLVIELGKKLYSSVNPAESLALMREIETENRRWEAVHNDRMSQAAKIADRSQKKHMVSTKPDPDLLKINLAEMHNKTTAELIGVMGKVLANNPVTNWLLGVTTFKRAEGFNRRFTAINYIYDAVMKGETDVELIKLQAAKGIARTQALYDQMNRRLRDRTKLGRFELMFGQYPYFMKQVFKATIKQSKEQDNPKLRNKLMWEWYRDTVMSGFNFFFQGMRTGSPINMTINGVLVLLLNALKRWSDDEEPFDFADWDTREVIFNLLQFKIGMGIGLIFGTLYNHLTGQDTLISIGRIGRAFDLIYKLLFPEAAMSENQQKWVDKNSEQFWLQQGLRYGVGINPLFPLYSPDFTDKDLIEHYKTPLPQKIFDFWEPFIPLYPHIKYRTDL